jgi:hypothetical protein
VTQLATLHHHLNSSKLLVNTNDALFAHIRNNRDGRQREAEPSATLLRQIATLPLTGSTANNLVARRLL